MNVTQNLVYFAYPKCASALVRQKLKLCNNNKYVYNDWDACDIEYCHVRPSIYINQQPTATFPIDYFTIIRNTYERLVSAYIYMREFQVVRRYHVRRTHFPVDQYQPFKTLSTFADFINMIYTNKDTFETIPMYWMFLPFDKYFKGLYDNPNMRFHVFDLSDMNTLTLFLQSHNIKLDMSKKINTSKHDHYASYYTDDLIAKVNEVYHYEIDKYQFTLSQHETQQSVV
jgi:hypothetical protein